MHPYRHAAAISPLDRAFNRAGSHHTGHKINEIRLGLCRDQFIGTGFIEVLLKRVVIQAQCTGGLVEPVLSGQACGPTPEFFGQSGVFAVLAAPLVELATRRGQGNRNVRWLSAAHQSFSQKVGFAGQPDDPLHGPPIKRNLPATTDDTSNNESFHTPLPKGHDFTKFQIATSPNRF
jgi:hypothetical protein